MKKFCTIFSVVMAFAFSANAAVTLQECRDKARENYPLVSRYDLVQATKECNVHNASLAWLPRLEIGVSGGWFCNTTDAEDLATVLGELGQAIDMSGKTEQPWQYKVDATLTQSVWDGGASAFYKKMAQANADKDAAELEVSFYELQRQVDEVYFSILLLEERLKQSQGRMQVLENNLAKMQSVFDEGELSAMDLKSMEAEVKEARQQIKLIENNIASSRLSLSLLTSMDLSKEELIVPTVPETIPSRPEYAFIESSQKILELKMKKLNVDLSPKILFLADAYYGYPGRNIFKGLTDHNPSFNAFLGVQLKFDLSPLYTRRNDKTLIANQMHELDLQRDLLNFKIRLANTGVSQEIEFLRQTLEDDTEILRLRTDVRVAAEERLESGVIDASDLLQKINDEAHASLQKSIHQIELLQALYRQEKIERPMGHNEELINE